MNIVKSLQAILNTSDGKLFGRGYYLEPDGTLYSEILEGKHSGKYSEFCYLPEVTKMVVEEDKIELITEEDGEVFVSTLTYPSIREINEKLDELIKNQIEIARRLR